MDCGIYQVSTCGRYIRLLIYRLWYLPQILPVVDTTVHILTNEFCTKTHSIHRSNYDANLNYVPNNNATSKPRRNRQRKIIWFNSTRSKNVRTNVAKNFLQLIDKHFPKSSRLHKIFNRNTIKVSYSCMENVKIGTRCVHVACHQNHETS